MLMGSEWTYGYASHAFFKGTQPRPGGVETWLCAETFEPLTIEQLRERRAETREMDRREINENIRQREEARTHEARSADKIT